MTPCAPRATAFATWRHTNPLERAKRRVLAFADLIVEHAEELAMLDVVENGSPIREMRGDAQKAAGQLRYFAGLALQLRGETIPGDFERVNYTLLQPFGVVGRIVPFNHPLMFAAGKIGRAADRRQHDRRQTLRAHLDLGAAPRPSSPAKCSRPAWSTSSPATATRPGDALVTHPDVRRLAFTGSAEIGRRIQQRAATHVVKTVTLELGGKNPIVVFDDADMRGRRSTGRCAAWTSPGRASRAARPRACWSTGHCHDEFVARLGERHGRAALRGPRRRRRPTPARSSTARQYEKVLGYLQLGRDEGARVVAGGGPPDDPALAAGMFVRPTLFDDVRPDSRLAQEEIFGPVLAAMPFDTYDEALAIANGVSLGLTASVYTPRPGDRPPLRA